MPKPPYIELGDGTRIPILYEDRSVIAIDKPRGWMLVPYSWQKTNRNLQAALVSPMAAGKFWARSRGLKFLRHVHRLDAETSGVLLLARSRGALDAFGDLFESRRVEKTYLAIVRGVPAKTHWICRLKLAPDPKQMGRMRVDPRAGKDAETHFSVMKSREDTALVEARPVTGRTHQIRVHLAEAGHPVLGDSLYGKRRENERAPLNLALRAIRLRYTDPFTRRPVEICAPAEEFLAEFGFAAETSPIGNRRMSRTDVTT